jgi:hypothetical protein
MASRLHQESCHETRRLHELAAVETDVTKKFRISGPGAADFLTAQGGVDFPETDPSKGMAQTRDEGVINDATVLEPDLDPPDPSVEREREIIPPDRGGQRSK